MRIISLVPSITELLIDLGLGKDIVGRTKFCIHPKGQVSSIPKIGGTKNIHVDKVLALAPTHIIANKEENTKDQIQQLQASCNVLVTKISDYPQALAAIREIGIFTDSQSTTNPMVAKIEEAFSKLQSMTSRLRVCYLIWRRPYMTIGADTFIHDMLYRCGLHNVYEEYTRYPEVAIDDLIVRQPDLVFLSSEPYPFTVEHMEEIQKALPDTKILLVDGEYFSWYGSRMIPAVDYFNNLITTLKLEPS